MANAFKTMDGQHLWNMRRPMLWILAEHIMNSPNGVGGRRPPAPLAEGRREATPLMCSASIESISIEHTDKFQNVQHCKPTVATLSQTASNRNYYYVRTLEHDRLNNSCCLIGTKFTSKLSKKFRWQNESQEIPRLRLFILFKNSSFIIIKNQELWISKFKKWTAKVSEISKFLSFIFS